MGYDSSRDRSLRAACRSSNIFIFLAVAFFAACADDATAPLQSERTDLAPVFSASGRDREDGEYIVVLRELPQGRDRDDVERVARFEGASPRYVYTAALQGFAANLNRGQIEKLRRNADVEFIEEDQEVTADVTQTLPAGEPWG
ncbi:MAG: protease inhibitor I9 family protein, partial [Longimicrobiales bacterium]